VLARRLLEVFAADLGRRGLRLSPEAEAKLVRHRWPGNVRELRNVLERAILLSGREVLEAGDLRLEGSAVAPVEGPAPGATLTLDELERQHIARVVESLGGRVAEASHRLGIPRSTLYQKIKKYGIPLPRSS